MNIREIENSIIAKLKQNFPEILVEGFPDKPSEFILLTLLELCLYIIKGAIIPNQMQLVLFLKKTKKNFL